MKQAFSLLTLAAAKSLSQTDMFNCISDSLPTADWEQMITNFNNAETQSNWADTVADAALTCYDSFTSDLPNVCAGGKSCRSDVRDQLRPEITTIWVNVFAQIATAISNRKVNVATRVSGYYQRAYDCQPGCTCSNVGVSYDSWVNRERQVWNELTELRERRCSSWCQAMIYGESCPNFDKMPEYDWIDECNCNEGEPILKGNCPDVVCGTNEIMDPVTCECSISTITPLMIINPHSSKPFQIKDGSSSAGAGVEIGTMTKGPGQVFILEHTDDSATYFRIKNIHSGLYLSMPNDRGVQMTQELKSDSLNQIFFFESAQQRIKEVRSNLVIDIYGGNSTADGVRIIGWPGHSNWNQKWIIQYI